MEKSIDVVDINAVALQFLFTLSVKETYKLICKEGIKLTGTRYCSIYLGTAQHLEKVYASSPKFYRIVARNKNGFTYTAFRTRTAFTIDIERFAHEFPELKKLGVQSTVFIPLSYQGIATGVINMQSLEQKRFTKEQLNVLELFGSMASLAIQKARVYEKSQVTLKSRDHFSELKSNIERIYKAGLKFLVPLTPQETYTTILQEALKLVNADFGSIFLPKDGVLERVYTSFPKLNTIVPRKKGITYAVYKSRTPRIITAEKVKKIHPAFVTKIKALSDIVFPLSYRNESIGVISLQSKQKNHFAKKDLEILKFFAPLASLAIRKTQLYDEAKKAVELRDLFISIAAHELRTPLTTLNGYIQLFFNKLKKQEKETTELRWVTQMVHESKRLTRMIQELLEITHIQTGKLHYSWKEERFTVILTTALESFKLAYPRNKLIIKNMITAGNDCIIADYDKLVQAITNILVNAVKFSPITKPIAIQVAAHAGNIVLKIRDQGKGIAPSELEKIFELFYKGARNTGEGMGLGLYLVKNIITQHRGKIYVESYVNKGTTVTITLPIIKL